MLLSILSLTAFSQNYQTITSNQQNYFGSHGLNQILATRTDSVIIDGNDSIFYSYKAVRSRNNYEHFNFPENCLYQLGPNWYGSHVIIKENGHNLFFNRFNDTITIATQSNLNDTFLAYLYPNGDSLYGTVTVIDTMTILGSLDSVKTITLSHNSDPTITHLSLKLSKHHGFVQLFSPYSFPYAYKYVPGNNDTLSPPDEVLCHKNTRLQKFLGLVANYFRFWQ